MYTAIVSVGSCASTLYFLKGEKHHEVGYVKRKRNIWEELGEEGEYVENILYEKVKT